jgi:putative membrane protein
MAAADDPASSLDGRAFFGKPFAWLAFALLLVAVPLVGYMVRAGLPWNRLHPAINAMLNGTSAVFLASGWFAIRRRQIAFHRACMISAFTASSVFLASYLARFALTGAHKYPGAGWDRSLYLAILLSHMVLALIVLPMVLRTLYLGLKGRWAAHRKLARWTWPIWMYVSVTGVAVYFLLYHLGPALH